MNNLLKFHQKKWLTASSPPPEDVKEYVEYFKRMDEMTPPGIGFFLLVNVNSFQYDYIGKDHPLITGYSNERVRQEGLKFHVEHIHPEDVEYTVKVAYPKFQEAMQQCPAEDLEHLRLQTNYRFRHADGHHIHLIEQVRPLILDEERENRLLLTQVQQMPLLESFQVNVLIERLMPEEQAAETVYEESFPKEEEKEPALTGREFEVIQLLAEGMSSKEIADHLYLSVHTVRTHRKKILKKLELKNTVQLTAFAAAKGIV